MLPNLGQHRSADVLRSFPLVADTRVPYVPDRYGTIISSSAYPSKHCAAVQAGKVPMIEEHSPATRLDTVQPPTISLALHQIFTFVR